MEKSDAVAAAACRVATLTNTLQTSPADALGGKATVRRLDAFLTRADKFLGLAERGTKTEANLRRARRELKAMEKAVRRGLNRKRTPIDPELGQFLLGLARAATNDVGIPTTVR